MTLVRKGLSIAEIPTSVNRRTGEGHGARDDKDRFGVVGFRT